MGCQVSCAELLVSLVVGSHSLPVSTSCSAGEAAAGADIVLSILGYPEDVEATYLGAGGTEIAAGLDIWEGVDDPRPWSAFVCAS